MNSQHNLSRAMLLRRTIFLIALLTLIGYAGFMLWHYQAFVFKHAVKEMREAPEKYRMVLVKWFPFSEDRALKEWEEKVFKGKVVYLVEKDQSLSYVRATSAGSASALYYKLKMDARTKRPVISWKWDVEKFPTKTVKESLGTQNEDDFAARVYVIFPALFITNSKVLEYIWAETLPEGMTGTSPYSKNIKLIVAHSGPNPDKQWFFEERDIVADYEMVFGRKPEYNIGAVAFMTNAEHTGTSADAMYDEIKLGYQDDATSTGGKTRENEIPQDAASHQ